MGPQNKNDPLETDPINQIIIIIIIIVVIIIIIIIIGVYVILLIIIIIIIIIIKISKTVLETDSKLNEGLRWENILWTCVFNRKINLTYDARKWQHHDRYPCYICFYQITWDTVTPPWKLVVIVFPHSRGFSVGCHLYVKGLYGNSSVPAASTRVTSGTRHLPLLLLFPFLPFPSFPLPLAG